MTKNWWFKFDFRVWRTDSDLRRCSLETKGFWLDLLCVMHETGEASVTGTYEELGRLVGCDPSTAARCVAELQRTKTADVTFCNDDVTLMSRRIERELSSKENTKLRVAKHRSNADVTPVSQHRVISKSKSKKKEEENTQVQLPPQRVHPPPPEEADFFQTVEAGLCERLNVTQLRDQGEWYETLIFAYQNKFSTEHVLEVFDLLRRQKWRKGRVTGKNVGDNLTEIVNLRADIDQQRQSNGKSQGNVRQSAAERNWQNTLANEQLGEDLRSGKLDGLLDELHRRDPLYRHEILPPRQSPAALAGGFDDHGEGLDGFPEADSAGEPFS